MTQLAKRHDLEIERPLIEQELEGRYDRQEVILRVLSWIIAALFVGSVIVYLINRFLRQRAIFNLRNRIAADLHDELGANLHAVSMLGELASNAKHDPEKMNSLVERMRTLIQRTSKAVNYCTNILETPGLYEDFEDAMKRNADRLLADLDHTLLFEAKDTISKIRPGRRIDLFLFYKECLTNIIRHSGATHAESHVTKEGRHLQLSVSDNGHGFPKPDSSNVPGSLKRRAKLLGGTVTARSSKTEGVQIRLSMKI
jgi:signal transduction histidine kinase